MPPVRPDACSLDESCFNLLVSTWHMQHLPLPLLPATIRAPAGMSLPGLSLHTSLEAVPGVWASAHHNCIVWCNQLTVKLAQTLLSLGAELRAAADVRATGEHLRGSGGAPADEDGADLHRRTDQGRVGWDSSWLQERNQLVMERVRKALLGTSLHSQLQLPAPGSNSGSAAGASAVGDRRSHNGGSGSSSNGDSTGSGSSKASNSGRRATVSSSRSGLGEVLARAAGPQCKGANLAWYMQYLTPRVVARPLLQLRHSSIKVCECAAHLGEGWR